MPVFPQSGQIVGLTLNSYLRNPDTTVLIVLGAMFVLPMLARYFRSSQMSRKQC